MDARLFARGPLPTGDLCEHCGSDVDRVWLVPGDVLNSCQTCFRRATGRAPVHAHGFSSPPRARPAGAAASFHLRADGRRPA